LRYATETCFSPTPSMPPKRGSSPSASSDDAPKRGSARREWCVTVFSDELVGAPAALLATLTPHVRYCVFQREIAPDTGRKHLQMYLAFPKQVTMAGAKKLLGDNSAHFAPRYAESTPLQAATYCKKPETRDPAEGSGPFETGSLPAGQGKRSDLVSVQAALDAGASDREIADTHFAAFVRYHRGFQLYRTLHVRDRSDVTFAVVYWGPPGSGKTRAAANWYPSSTFWLPRPSGSGTAWWDGYAQQRVVVLDEFIGWLRRDLLCRLLDRTPLRVECKGGSLAFTSRYCIFTSNLPPDQWYRNIGLGPLMRRISEPLGAVVYVGNESFPDAASYTASLGGFRGAGPRHDADGLDSQLHWVQTSDDVRDCGVFGRGL